MNKNPQRRLMVTTGLVVAVLTVSGIAYAATSDPTQTAAATQTTLSLTTTGDQTATNTGATGVAEEPLTGDLAAQVTTAAEAAVPGGSVDRVETDAQGAAYEAHMTDADGNPVTVTFDENLNVVATETGGCGPGHGEGNGIAEEPLTGDLATQVTTAAEAAVPGGTVIRVETDAQGAAYEAHMTDADGNPITVTFDENLDVIATETGGHGPGHGGRVADQPSTADLGA